MSGKKGAPAPAAAPAAAATPSSYKPLPLWQRKLDLLIVFWFIVFPFTTTFTDLHNFIASAKGVPTEALEHMDLPYPPKVLTDIYFKWGRTVDPLLFLNPMWWQCIEWINLLCLTPFSFAAIYGFWAGADWVRVPAIVISSFTPYSLVLCMGSTIFGDVKSAEPSTFLGVYQLYLFFPFLVIARLWRDAPFARRLAPGTETALWVYGSVTFAVFFSYVAKWLVVHTPELLTAPVLAALAAAKSLP